MEKILLIFLCAFLHYSGYNNLTVYVNSCHFVKNANENIMYLCCITKCIWSLFETTALKLRLRSAAQRDCAACVVFAFTYVSGLQVKILVCVHKHNKNKFLYKFSLFSVTTRHALNHSGACDMQ